MKKKLVLLGIVSILLMTLVSPMVQADDLESVEQTFSERVNSIYGWPSIKRTVGGVVHKDGTRYLFEINGTFLPLRELFESDMEEIAWDNQRKVAIVRQGKKELVLNFSEQEWQAAENQIVLPKEWIRFEDGITKISAPFLAYVFDRYAGSDQTRHKEADEWREKLSFLGIQYINGINSSAKDGALHFFMIMYHNEKE